MDIPVEQASQPPEDQAENVTLLFHVPAAMPSKYAHHLMVQGAEHEVILSFFEILPPLLTGTAEEQKAILQKGVRADCVARITVARARYPEFVKTMQGMITALADLEASK